jgi:hypothetical protein
MKHEFLLIFRDSAALIYTSLYSDGGLIRLVSVVESHRNNIL